MSIRPIGPQLGDTLLDSSPSGVRCPGCCAQAASSAALVHEDGCMVARRIEAVTFAFQQIGADENQPIERRG